MMSTKATIEIPNFFAETLKDTLDEWHMPQGRIAEATGIPSPHLTELKKGRRRCTAEYDLRLSQFFGIEPGMFMRLQLRFDMMKAERECGEQIRKEVIPLPAA